MQRVHELLAKRCAGEDVDLAGQVDDGRPRGVGHAERDADLADAALRNRTTSNGVPTLAALPLELDHGLSMVRPVRVAIFVAPGNGPYIV